MTDTFGIIQRILFFTLLVGVTLFFLWILSGFAMAIFWAVILAVVLFPTFRFLKRDVRNSSLAALVTILFTLIVIFGPLYLLGDQLTSEAIALYQRLSQDSTITYTQMLENIPFATEALEAFGISMEEFTNRLVESGRTAAAWIASEAFGIGIATFSILLQALVMLYLLFYFLRDGEKLSAYVGRILPLGADHERALFDRFVTTTRSIIKGTLVVALAQGAIGGILFWIAGIPNPVLWGSVMAFLALIPAVGPALIWLPAGVILLFMGAIWQGVVVLAGGAIIISLTDNVLRPILVGRDTAMPDPLILISMLGGLAAFGISGLIIGPVTAAFFLAMWDIFGTEYSQELSERG